MLSLIRVGTTASTRTSTSTSTSTTASVATSVPIGPATAYTVTLNGLGRTFTTSQPVSSRGRSALSSSRPVLRNVSITVHAGEVVAILGTSGCGKSTLLRMVGGLDEPSTGSVRIDGSPVTPFDSRCAVGFQEPRLLPWRSVAANVALGVPRGTQQGPARQRVAELLHLTGLTAFAEHRPSAISGGMAQRASLARALARNPGVLLLDEPFGALDALTRLKMQDLLLDVHAAAPTTVLLVTHDVDEALHVADRIIVLGHDTTDTAGAIPPRPGATIVQELTVPGGRPRNRGSNDLAELRARLLVGLGVNLHNPARPASTTQTIDPALSSPSSTKDLS